MSTEERKLAAIVFTDIVGFTELMGRDEAKAMNLLKQNRALLRPIVENFKGEWLKEIGDGVLISFPSAVMAVTCALEIQRILAHNPDLTLRIGIHVGDVIQKDGDVFGDGVNIASRLEPLAEPGGICVSERVHEDIRNKPEISTAFQEEQLLKGVDKPIKVYSIFTQMGVAPTPESLEANSAKKSSGMNMGLIAGVGALVLAGVLFFIRDTTPDKPKDERKSIAVLPFDNMSEEGNSDYFSDGITEDIITYLSKIEGLKVISRTSIMQYKDTKMNLKDIAKELGVTNILEGSVRRSGDKVRITGQLIDAETDEHLWAEMYDRTLDDIFTVQTEVAKSIAAALETEMTDKDIERLNKTMTTNPDAYELLHKTKTLKWFIPDDNFKKLELYEKAAMLDPESAYIHARLGHIHSWLYFFGSDRTEKRLEKAKAALDKAMELDPLLAEVHQDLGHYHYVLADYEKALQEYALADRLEPNNVETLWRQSLVYRRQGKFEESYSAMEKCHVLDPKNYLYPSQLVGMATMVGNAEKFDHYFAIATELGMEVSFGLYLKEIEKFGRNGDLDEYRKIVDEANKVDHDTWFHVDIAYYYVITGDYNMALKHLERRKPEDAVYQTGYVSDLYWKAIIYKTKGNGEKSKQLFEDALDDVNDKLEELPDDARMLLSKGKILAYLSKKEEAVRLGEKAISLKSIETDKLQGGDYNYHLANIYALVGEYDLAIQELRKVYEVKPKNAWIGYLLHDAEMANIQDYPPFKDLITEIRKVQNLD
jgi:TolB-like protein/class 3 adenylate cyclase/Tfp pilus assembly protein PilF